VEAQNRLKVSRRVDEWKPLIAAAGAAAESPAAFAAALAAAADADAAAAGRGLHYATSHYSGKT
jgi:hypothetical protein